MTSSDRGASFENYNRPLSPHPTAHIRAAGLRSSRPEDRGWRLVVIGTQPRPRTTMSSGARAPTTRWNPLMREELAHRITCHRADLGRHCGLRSTSLRLITTGQNARNHSRYRGRVARAASSWRWNSASPTCVNTDKWLEPDSRRPAVSRSRTRVNHGKEPRSLARRRMARCLPTTMNGSDGR
jgi:hypothetical protein